MSNLEPTIDRELLARTLLTKFRRPEFACGCDGEHGDCSLMKNNLCAMGADSMLMKVVEFIRNEGVWLCVECNRPAWSELAAKMCARDDKQDRGE